MYRTVALVARVWLEHGGLHHDLKFLFKQTTPKVVVVLGTGCTVVLKRQRIFEGYSSWALAGKFPSQSPCKLSATL